jgi:hypothetical protein
MSSLRAEEERPVVVRPAVRVMLEWSLYLTLVKRILIALWFFSLPNLLGWLVRKKTGIKVAWLPEVYQVATVVLMVWTIFNPTPSPILVGFAMYRPAEILIFVLHWVVSEDKTLLDVRRAAVGFLINQAEVVLCFAALLLRRQCDELEGPAGALYNSLRTVVTIGPASPLKGCETLLAAEMIVASSSR